MLEQTDYDCIGIMAKHCDLTKLCVAEQEALKFDVAMLFCDYWDELLAIWNEVNAYILAVQICDADPECTTPPVEPENYSYKYSLVFGGTYLNCAEKSRTFEGLKALLVYYSYARYVMLNGFNDTSTGIVQKTNEFSIPIDAKALKDFADKYRSMGYITFERIVGYLCANNTIFTGWTDCKKCGCGTEKCNGSTKARGYGFKSSIISRY